MSDLGLNPSPLPIIVVVLGFSAIFVLLAAAYRSSRAKAARERVLRGIQKQDRCAVCSGQLSVGRVIVLTSASLKDGAQFVGTASCQNCGRLEFFA